MLKPAGAENRSCPIPVADSGRRGAGGEGGEGGEGEVGVESGIWGEGKGRVNTGGDETAQTSAGQHLFLLFILFHFLAFFFLISNTKTMF